MRLPNPYAVPLVTIEVAGELLGMSRTAAYRAAGAGEQPTVTFNGTLRVATADLYRLCRLPMPAPAGVPLVDRSR